MPTSVIGDPFEDFFDDSSALDIPLDVSLFQHVSKDVGCKAITANLRNLAEMVSKPNAAAAKDGLPLLKLAKFGKDRGGGVLLRNDGNVTTISGIEADYDLGEITIADAADRLRAAGLAGLFYTTASHTTVAPRWRLLVPTSEPRPPSERAALYGRLAAATGIPFDSASAKLSQAFFFGTINGCAAPQIELIDGCPIDRAPITGASIPEPANDADDDDANFRIAPDWERIDSALAAIPVSEADKEVGGRDLWLEVGMSLHSVSHGGEDGFSRWNVWAAGGKKYKDEHDQRKNWKLRKVGGKMIGIGTLFYRAASFGWNMATEAEPESPSEGAAKCGGLRFLSPTECASASNRGYVIKGLIAPGDVGCIFGAPGAGKSLLAPHLGWAVAQGRQAFGMRTRQGGIFYVAAEDAHGMRGRITALIARHGNAPAFTLVEGVSDLLAVDSPERKELQAAVRGRRPALIVLDTLAMSFPALEENSADGMGRVVAVARKLAMHGAAVLLIHHDTKAAGSTPRGHSLLNGALDMALQLFPRDEMGIVRGNLTKNRNGTCDRDIAFRIEVEERERDEDGDPVTSAIVAELDAGTAPRRQKLSASEAAALRILSDLVEAGGVVTENQWAEACTDGRTVCGSDDRASRRKAFNRALAALARKDSVSVAGGFVALKGGRSVYACDSLNAKNLVRSE